MRHPSKSCRGMEIPDEEEIEEVSLKKQTKRRRDDTRPVEPRKRRGQGQLSDVVFEDLPGIDLSIRHIETSKDEIEQPELAAHERMIIPPINSCSILSGASGCGKSTLLANLITDERFYGRGETRPDGWFKNTYIFSPTADSDDIQKELGIPKNHVFTDLDEGAELLGVLQKDQMSKLAGGGKAAKVGKINVIFDDVIGETSFMNTPQFKRMFYMVRHMNATCWLCTQHFPLVPKIARLQAGFVFFFAGSAAAVEIIVEEYGPPQYSRKEFRSIVNQATRKKHSFLTICTKVPWKYRFRRNLGTFIHLTRLEDDEGDEVKQEPRASKRSKPTFSEKTDTTKDSLKIAHEYYVARNAGKQNEQARCFGEWVCKGPRSRTLR